MSMGNHHPLAGGIDLSALKISAEQRKRIRQIGLQLFVQNGLICRCGEKIVDDGVQLILYREGIIDTPRGPEPGAQMLTSHFHSRTCSELKKELRKTRSLNEPQPVALRPVPSVEWLDGSGAKIASDRN
jgi:hypothetical protein